MILTPLVAAFFDPSSTHFSVVEQARKQKQSLAFNQRYVAPALLSAPTEVLLALTKSDEELKNFRFLTRDARGREINLKLVEELEKVPTEYRMARARECFTMPNLIKAITEVADALPPDLRPKQTPTKNPEPERNFSDEEEFDPGSIMDLTEHIYPNPPQPPNEVESEVDFL